MKTGDKVMYNEKAATVVAVKGKFISIQAGNKELTVDQAVLTEIPADTPINKLGKVGIGSVIPKDARARYIVHKNVKTAGGKSPSIDNNDDVATILRGVSIEDAYGIAVKQLKDKGVETSVEALKAKYSKLNVGMQRMNMGNLIRGAGKELIAKMKKDEAKAKRDEAAAAAKDAKAEAKAAPAPAKPAPKAKPAASKQATA